jgi:hypothetical protein
MSTPRFLSYIYKRTKKKNVKNIKISKKNAKIQKVPRKYIFDTIR